MALIRMFSLLVFATFLVGCPAKTKILYLKLSLDKEIARSEFLKRVGNNVDAPLADEKVGFNFLPNQCEHRQYKSKNENTLLGTCVLKSGIYIYALLPDHGDDPQKYLVSPNMAETLTRMNQYKKNAESYLKGAGIPYQSNGHYLEDKLQFMRMLEGQAKH